MRFRSHEDRMQHPQASIIPKHVCTNYHSLWHADGHEFYPDMEFTDELLSMIEVIKNSSQIPLSYLRENESIVKRVNKKLGFIIALCHPKSDLQSIRETNDLLGLSDDDFFKISAEIGNLELMKVIAEAHTDPEWIQKIVKANRYKIFRESAANGYLPILRYIAEVVPDELQNMIVAKKNRIATSKYSPFRQAAQNGHLHILQYLAEQAPDKLQDMIASDHYEAFRFAAFHKDNSILKYLVEQAPDKVEAMIAAENYEAFIWAAARGNLSALHYLAELAPDKLQEMITAEDYNAFNWAAWNGHLEVLDYLAEQAPDKLQAMIAEKHYQVFNNAAARGKYLVLDYLAKKAPDKLQAMIEAEHYGAFRYAAREGHLEIMHYLAEHDSDKLEDMISAFGYTAFSDAASNGHLDILNYLAEQVPDKLQEMIAAKDYAAFRWAAARGHQSVLDYLTRMAPDKLQAMIAANGYRPFFEAARHGHLEVLDYLEKQAPNKLQEMIAADNYAAFRWAASNRHLSVLHYLAEKAPDKVEEMITTKNYDAFRGAATREGLLILQYLAELAPDKLQAMIASENYHAFRMAACSGSISIMRYLAEQAPDKLDAMIMADNYSAFHSAVNMDDEIIHFLLTTPIGFAHAESNEYEYADYTLPFINERLNALRALKGERADEPILVTAEEAKQFFYVARALIRRHASIDDLSLILEIPQVKELAHQAVTPRCPNELLRLAAQVNNQEAANYLLTIPAVQREAEANNFYLNELFEEGINLRVLAQDRESSMTALSRQESECLETLKNRYLEKDKDPAQILEELRHLLIKRYEALPAVITMLNTIGDTKDLVLPYAWEDFIALSLSKKEKQLALQAYYKNKDHTAWRFLQKPNQWMHPRALYTNHDHLGQWSSFEAYAELISVLFLAAKDENISGIDGYNVDDRVTQFIDELALIGRSHNWDKKNIKGEEYDDLTADKPSCYSGTKRRLFQSVQGHPLLKQLTLDILEQELREFVWHHFQEIITEKNNQALSTIWQKTIDTDSLTDEEIKLLLDTNISKEDQKDWIKKLHDKYGDQADHFAVGLSQRFNLSHKDSHFIRFAYLGLDQLLKNSTVQGENSKAVSKDVTTQSLSQINTVSFFCQERNQARDNNPSLSANQL